MAKPVKEAKTLVPGIALALRELIWKGKLQPGQHINQADWAENLGVSLIPLREAMRILEGEGLVELLPNRGAQVTPVSRREIQEWFLEYKGLISAFLPLAVPLITPATLARLRTMAQRLDEEHVEAGLHLDFWRLIFEPCGLPRLLSLHQQLIWRLGRYFLEGGKVLMTELRDTHPNRDEFLDACEAGDADGALRAILRFAEVRMNAFADRHLAASS